MDTAAPRHDSVVNEPGTLRDGSSVLRSRSRTRRCLPSTLRGDPSTVRDHFGVFRDGSSVLRRRSSTLRRRSSVVRSHLEALRDDSSVVRSRGGVLRGRSSALRNDSEVLRDDSSVLRRRSSVPRGGPSVLRSHFGALRGDSSTMRDDPGVLRNGGGVLRNDSGMVWSMAEPWTIGYSRVSEDVNRVSIPTDRMVRYSMQQGSCRTKAFPASSLTIDVHSSTAAPGREAPRSDVDFVRPFSILESEMSAHAPTPRTVILNRALRGEGPGGGKPRHCNDLAPPPRSFGSLRLPAG